MYIYTIIKTRNINDPIIYTISILQAGELVQVDVTSVIIEVNKQFFKTTLGHKFYTVKA